MAVVLRTVKFGSRHVAAADEMDPGRFLTHRLNHAKLLSTKTPSSAVIVAF